MFHLELIKLTHFKIFAKEQKQVTRKNYSDSTAIYYV